MKGDFIYGVGCRIVVLNRFVAPDVEDLDYFVSTAASDASTVWVEFYGADTFVMVVEGANMRFGRHIPHFAGCVLRS